MILCMSKCKINRNVLKLFNLSKDSSLLKYFKKDFLEYLSFFF